MIKGSYMKSFLRKFFLGLIVAQALFLTPFSVELKVNIPKTENSLFAVQEEKSSQSLVEISPVLHTANALYGGGCDGGSPTTWGECILSGILTFYHYLFFTTTQILAAIAAYFMDVIIKFSISSSFYRGIGIIEVGWEILRDLSNIIFLFALLYIAFRFAINGIKDGQAKKSLINVIVAALVVNFSLFICYFLIDASNLFAHVFYNRITTEASIYPTNNGAGQEGLATVLNDIKSPATAFLAAINPQRLLLTDADIATNGGMIKILSMIMGMAIVNGIAIWVFLSVALLFLTRILGLIILSFLSPLAFSSLAIPEMKKQKYVGFDDWLNNFLRMSFAAPIFTFFLWVATKFASNEGVIGTIQRNSGGDWILDMLNVFLVMALIAGILVMSKKITQDLAGNFSKQITGMIGKAVAGTAAVGALAVAAPVAGVGMLARAGAGVTSATGGLARGARALNMTGAADRLQKAQEKLKSNRFGTTAANAGRALMSTKLNVTKIPGFSQLAGKELTSIVGKVPGVGVSARELERKAVLYGMRNVPLYRDKEGKWKRNFLTGRQHQEAELAYDKEKEKIRGERGKWQEDLKKERDKFEQEKVVNAMRDKVRRDTKLDPERKAERDAHNAVLENSDLVKKETEAMDALKGELANLTAQLNAAKGSGNDNLADTIQMEIDGVKVRRAAREKGIELSGGNAENMITDKVNGGMSRKEAVKAIIEENKDGFGTTTTYHANGGVDVTAETLQGRHQHEKNLLNEEERNLIRAEITNLRTQATAARTAGRDDEADTLNKKASHLSQKMESMLTDSSKIDEAANKASNKK
ncbi:MAG: hypothetical protein PHC89_01380 [Candidatus Pacebacteria bacterium]|nr:hypothetical protein [Candidatus Paceibacterota bacterium]